MVFVYNGVKVFYEIKGSGPPCLLLHGWGCSGEIFADFLSRDVGRRFVVVDLPPFGRSGDNIDNWCIFTYASMLMSLCEHLEISSCDCIGHSFGGRVAILLASLKRTLVKNLVLVDSAGLKPRRSLGYYFKVFSYKVAKRLGFSCDVGSPDYKALPDHLKSLFVNVVNERLDEYCTMIHARTLIIFGANDKDTPPYMAKRLHKLIKNSKLVFLEDAGHYSFLDCPLLFYRKICEFLEGQ